MTTSLLKRGIQTLSPAYFALVMATGIVSTAAHLHQYALISDILFWLNNIFFVGLLIFFLCRLVFFFPETITDLSSHAKGAGFLTLVAASAILGTSWAQAKKVYLPAEVLWYLALAAWCVLVYAFLSMVILKMKKPSPEDGLNGIWFLLVVSSQSLSILSDALRSDLSWCSEASLAVSSFFLLLGAMLYLLLAPIITYRLLYYPVTPEEVVPAYWINMGAAAITTLSATTILPDLKVNPVFADLYPVVYGVAILFWCMASFWIPLVLIMEIWRCVIKRSELAYSPSLWSMVFPLGMYSVCTWHMAALLQQSFFYTLGNIFLYIAWLAWGLSFLGFLIHLFTSAHQRSNP